MAPGSFQTTPSFLKGHALTPRGTVDDSHGKMGSLKISDLDTALNPYNETRIQRQQATLARKALQNMRPHHDLEKGLGEKLGRRPVLL